MALMAHCGELLPMPDGAIFSDVKNEPEEVYRWLDWLEGVLSFPVYRVTAGDLKDKALKVHVNSKTKKEYYDTRIPVFVKSGNSNGRGQSGRHCTRDFKLRPLLKKQRELAHIKVGCKEEKVVSWVGISSDEIWRMKESMALWCKNRFPLVEKRMNRQDCKRWMETHGYPEPPRSACIFCPYHSDSEWRRMKDQHPSEFLKAVDFEKRLQVVQKSVTTPGKDVGIPFLHRSLKNLDEVDFSTDLENGQLSLWNNECEGMCGV